MSEFTPRPRLEQMEVLRELLAELYEQVETIRYDDKVKQAVIDAGHDCTVEEHVVINRLAAERDTYRATLSELVACFGRIAPNCHYVSRPSHATDAAPKIREVLS